MRNHEKVQTPLTSGEIFEFVAAVVEQLPRDLSPERVRYYSAKKNRLGEALYKILAKPERVVNIADWQNFYRRVLGRDVDFSDIHIPEKPKEGAWRSLVIPQGITANELYDVYAKRFSCWRYTDDLDAITDIVSRPDGSYAIWARDRREADEELKNLSANGIKERGLNTETLKECLIHGLKFHDETGEHLDVHNWTLCAGSRVPGGGVPSVLWNGAYMDVHWCHPDYRSEDIRARAAIS